MSGAIAGIAGVSEVAGIQNRLTAGLSPGFGYTGIVVAMLGGLTMPGVLVRRAASGRPDRRRQHRRAGAAASRRSWARWCRARCCWSPSGLLAVRRNRAARRSRRPTRGARAAGVVAAEAAPG